MKASRSSLSDWRQSLPSGWIGMVKKPSCIGRLSVPDVVQKLRVVYRVSCFVGRIRELAIARRPTNEAPRTDLLDGLRVDGRAGGAGDHQRRAAEEELVNLVGGAVVGQLFQVEH